MVDLPSAMTPLESRREVFVAYLDYFRSAIAERVAALPEDALRVSRVASGWTSLELVKHLTCVERRWLVWGFLGEDIGDPWADQKDGRWFVADDETRDALIAVLLEQGLCSREVIENHELTEVGQPSERWEGGPAPTLERILFHLFQEYARHLSHLEIVCEIIVASPTY